VPGLEGSTLVVTGSQCNNKPIDLPRAFYRTEISRVSLQGLAVATFWITSSISRRTSWLVLPLLWACGSSPADAVIAIDAGAPDGPSCDASTAGNVLLISRVTGTCLSQGAPTTVFGMPAFETAFSSDCTIPEVEWQLVATTTPNVFSVLHVATGDVLDVRLAQTTAGTPLILYPPTQLSNQRFLRRLRGAPYYDFEPQNAPMSCVQEIAGTCQIWPCGPAVTPQEWVVQQQDCQ
jgi:hypothetical protein